MPKRDVEGRVEDHLLETVDDAALRVTDDETGIEHRRVKDAEPDTFTPENPTEAFLRSITSGRITSAMQLCPHANHTSDRILTRARGTWLLGCKPCVEANLRVLGEDQRCDRCGRWTPHHERPPAKVLQLKTVAVVARFCDRCAEVIADS